MIRILTAILFLALFHEAGSQVYQSCPAPLSQQAGYMNPLYDEWLSAYDVKHYLLTLDVSNLNTFIGGSAEVVLQSVREMDTLVLELQDGLDVTSVMFTYDIDSLNYPTGNELSYVHRDQALYIGLDRTLKRGEMIRVKIAYEGYAGRDRGFFAGINHKKGNDYGFDVTYTLSEPLNARDWFPVKQVLEDKIDSVTFNLVCDKGLLAGSNGLLVNVEDVGSDHILTWKTHYPIAYYLISFAVADYMDYSFYAPLSNENDSVLVQNFIYDSEQVLTDWKEGIDETGPLITLYSQLLEDYPFALEKYGHSMAPLGGGMEHQTMTSIQGFSFTLVAHELAHQWFGDHVTCGNWQDIWVNEGFASYMEYIASEHLLGQEEADGWMENAISIALGEKSGSVYVPEDQVEDEYRLFSYGLSYKKGAILLHMIRFILDDDDLFFQVLRTYISSYKDGVATGEDFRTILEEQSQMDFSCFFQQWYYGEGYPVFQLFWEQMGDSLDIRSEQTGTAPGKTPLFQVPFELEIIFSDGSSRRVRLMQESNLEETTLPVDGIVKGIVFDPDSHLLATSMVSQKLPEGMPYRLGPNPVTSELTIQFNNRLLINAVRITSLSGREIYKAINTSNPLTLNLSSLADGPYLLELTIDSKTYKERIVKLSEN